MTVLDVCLCLQTLSDAIISFSFKLACCSFQRGVSEDRTEERAFFLPTVAARLSVISKSRPGGKRVRKEETNPASSSSSSDLAVRFFLSKTADTCQACESAPGAVYQSRSGAERSRTALGISGAETPGKKPERETCRGGNSKRPGARQVRLLFLFYSSSSPFCFCAIFILRLFMRVCDLE